MFASDLSMFGLMVFFIVCMCISSVSGTYADCVYWWPRLSSRA